jgi:hypothetical protein
LLPELALDTLDDDGTFGIGLALLGGGGGAAAAAAAAAEDEEDDFEDSFFVDDDSCEPLRFSCDQVSFSVR